MGIPEAEWEYWANADSVIVHPDWRGNGLQRILLEDCLLYTSLESKKAKADAKAAEEAKKTEAETVLKKLLASGMSADEILEKLK